MVYLDYNATAPLHPEVLDVMLPFLKDGYGNPASRHTPGRAAFEAVEQARAQIATAINTQPEYICFTSSGTESNNQIIKGVISASTRTKVVTSGIEHPCVHCAARNVARHGGTFLPVNVDEHGLFDNEELHASVDDNTAIVSVMLANNESGVIQDVATASEIAKNAGAVMHTDAAQALGKIPIDFTALNVDAMTLSAHKARGPLGVAALVLKTEVACDPLLEGGGQEEGRRSSTLNVPGIVGFGQAAMLAAKRAEETGEQLAKLRDTFEEKIHTAGATIFGHGVPRLPNTSYFGFTGIEGESLVVMLDQAGFAVASGSACSTTKNEPSHVLLAMGADPITAKTAVRLSISTETTAEQLDACAAAIIEITTRLGAMAAVT